MYIPHTIQYVNRNEEKLSVKITRTESQAKTREKLMLAAQELFIQNGLQGTSIDKIVALAGFTKGAFYSNFKSKDGILLSLLKKYKDEVFSEIDTLVEKSTKENLIGIIEEWLYFDTNDESWVILQSELAINAARNHEFSQNYADFLNAQFSALEKSMEKILIKLERKPKIPLPDLARMIKQTSHIYALNNFATNQNLVAKNNIATDIINLVFSLTE